MRLAYFDCFSGASGDMILGSLVDAGVDVESLKGGLAGLAVEGYSLAARKVTKQGLAATQFEVVLEQQHHQPHRHLHHIEAIIKDSRLPDAVKTKALSIFSRLAQAEATVHNTTIEKVHFHEVGAVDAIVDVVGACLGLELLGVTSVQCSAIPTGSGTVQCDHGTMPVPAPATALLLKGVPVAETDEVGELTTPTGAAILTTLAGSYGPLPAMIVDAAGYGAGRRDGGNRPNVLRVITGRRDPVGSSDEIVILQANLDDAGGEVIGHSIDRLFEAGALDVFTTPIFMKKNRPAVMLTVLAEVGQVQNLEDVLFLETPTFGIRRFGARRSKLIRQHQTVNTKYGPVRIKVGTRGGSVSVAKPEYDDCRSLADKNHVPLRKVMDEAMRIWNGPRGS